MIPSLKATRLIMQFEGCKLQAYRDVRGIPTIGFGHTIDVKMGESISKDEAVALLSKDLAATGQAVARLAPKANQDQFDALVSFAYNVGCGALAKSTLLQKLNAGDVDGAAAEFPKWSKSGGQVVQGLYRRRLAEQELFLSEA